jgi:hypothetical protein
MTTDFRALCARMADELDHYLQLLTDNRLEVHALSAEARAALAAPEQGSTDEKLISTYQSAYEPAWKRGEYHGCHVDGLRAVLARWGRPAVEPTDEQILAIQDRAVASFSPVHPDAQNLSAIEYARALEIRKARAVLQHLGRPAVEPVPVSERLPGPEDCDDQGRCWLLDRPRKNGPAAWMLRRPDDGMLLLFIAWAPHWAIPVPQEGADG